MYKFLIFLVLILLLLNSQEIYSQSLTSGGAFSGVIGGATSQLGAKTGHGSGGISTGGSAGTKEPDWCNYWGVYTGASYIFDDNYDKVGYATEFGLVVGISNMFEFGFSGFSDLFRNEHYIEWNLDNKREAYGAQFHIKFGAFGFNILSIGPNFKLKVFRSSSKKSGEQGKDGGGRTGGEINSKSDAGGGQSSSKTEFGKGSIKSSGSEVRNDPSSSTIKQNNLKKNSVIERSPGQDKGINTKGFSSKNIKTEESRVSEKKTSSGTDSNKSKNLETKNSGNKEEQHSEKAGNKDEQKQGKDDKVELDEDSKWFDIGLSPYVEFGTGIESSSVPFVRSIQSIGLKLNLDDRFGIYAKYSIVSYSSIFTKDLIAKMYGIYIAYYF